MNVLDAVLKVSGNSVTAVHEPTGTAIDLSRLSVHDPPGGRPGGGHRPAARALLARRAATARAPAAVFNLPLLYTEKTGSDATAFLTAADQLMAVRIDPSQGRRDSSVGQPVSDELPTATR